MRPLEDQARERAQQFREENELGDRPIKDVFELVHTTLGIDVLSIEAAETEHGLTMVDPMTHRVVIAVATTEHPMRLRSSVAHEVGHVLANDLTRDIDLTPGRRSPAEIQADAFARHLLLPSSAVAEFKAGEVDLKDVSDLVQEFGVSPQIAAIQLRQAKAISNDECSTFSGFSAGRLATRYGWRNQYDAMATDSARPRAPQSLMARAAEGYRRGVLDANELARWYGTTPDTVREDLGEPEADANLDDWGWRTAGCLQRTLVGGQNP